MISTVATDALVFKRRAIRNHSTDLGSIILKNFNAGNFTLTEICLNPERHLAHRQILSALNSVAPFTNME